MIAISIKSRMMMRRGGSIKLGQDDGARYRGKKEVKV